jgi:hypothetical protein
LSPLAKASARSSHPVWYLLVSGTLYCLAQAGSLRWAEALGSNSGIWPAAAVGLIAILGAPDGWRWRVAMATLAANVVAHIALNAGSYPLIPSVLVRLFADWGGAILVVRVLGERPNLERSAPLLTFAALVGMAITPIVALVAALVVMATSPLGWRSLGEVFVRVAGYDFSATLPGAVLALALAILLLWLLFHQFLYYMCLFLYFQM